MASVASPPPPLPLALELAELLGDQPAPRKRRSPPPPDDGDFRACKNIKERARRSALERLFAELRDELPRLDERASRKAILEEAIRCIRRKRKRNC